MRPDGSTPYYAAYGVEYKGSVVPFGETVLFKTPVSKTRINRGGGILCKADLAWERGIWVSKSVTYDQHSLLTRRGRIEARTVRRLEEGRRYDKALLGELTGFPWHDKLVSVLKFTFANEATHLPLTIQLDASAQSNLPTPFRIRPPPGLERGLRTRTSRTGI